MKYQENEQGFRQQHTSLSAEELHAEKVIIPSEQLQGGARKFPLTFISADGKELTLDLPNAWREARARSLALAEERAKASIEAGSPPKIEWPDLDLLVEQGAGEHRRMVLNNPDLLPESFASFRNECGSPVNPSTGASQRLGHYLPHKTRWQRLRLWWRQQRIRLSVLWYIYRTSFRSFWGHIQILDSKVFQYTDFGPGYRRLSDGSHVPEMRTHARSVDTSTLEAMYPWVDTVDQRIFLLGFDAGERWGRSNPDIDEQKHAG